MQLKINKNDYNFIFGYAFLKGINETFSSDMQGVKIRAGAMQMMLSGIFSEDIQTITEVLKVANNTETPKISEEDLAEYVADNSEKVADELIEELKKSKFTQKKTNEMINNLEKEK